jgi:GTPase SAR1 family protein
MQYRRTHGIFLCFDLSNHLTWDYLRDRWMSEIEEYSNEFAVVMLVGNKNDLPIDPFFGNDLTAIYEFADE